MCDAPDENSHALFSLNGLIHRRRGKFLWEFPRYRTILASHKSFFKDFRTTTFSSYLVQWNLQSIAKIRIKNTLFSSCWFLSGITVTQIDRRIPRFNLLPQCSKDYSIENKRRCNANESKAPLIIFSGTEHCERPTLLMLTRPRQPSIACKWIFVSGSIMLPLKAPFS